MSVTRELSESSLGADRRYHHIRRTVTNYDNIRMSASGGYKEYTDSDNIRLYMNIRYMRSVVLRYQDKNRSNTRHGGLEIVPDYGIIDNNSCLLCLVLNLLQKC